jgi:hypothetical protein
LDDADGTFGFALRYDRHDTIPEDRETCAFARTVTQLIQKGHCNLGKLLLAPSASSELKELGRERVGPSTVILNEIAEFNEGPEEVMGGTPGQPGLPGDLGKGRRTADGGNDFDDPQSPLQRLVGLVQIHG